MRGIEDKFLAVLSKQIFQQISNNNNNNNNNKTD